jgi:hypothetical protein
MFRAFGNPKSISGAFQMSSEFNYPFEVVVRLNVAPNVIAPQTTRNVSGI